MEVSVRMGTSDGTYLGKSTEISRSLETQKGQVKQVLQFRLAASRDKDPCFFSTVFVPCGVCSEPRHPSQRHLASQMRTNVLQVNKRLVICIISSDQQVSRIVFEPTAMTFQMNVLAKWGEFAREEK